MKYVLVAVLVIGSSTVAFLQTPQTATGSISGRVIDAGSGKPIPDTTVTYSADLNRTKVSVQTDSSGRFAFKAVPGGQLYLAATKDGYTGSSCGRRRAAFDRSFDFNAGEQLADVEIPICQFASLSGRVTDEQGEPVAGAEVSAHSIVVIAGNRSLNLGRTVLTDRSGRYEMTRLLPRTYVVTASFGSTYGMSGGGGGTGARQRSLDHPRVYYPDGLVLAQASEIEIGSGEVRMGVDLHQKTLVAVSVSGKVVGLPRYPGSPAPKIELRPEGMLAGMHDDLSVATTYGSLDGDFSFRRVPPGRYVARVIQFPMPTGRDLVGSAIQMSSGPTGFRGTIPPEEVDVVRSLPPDPTFVGEASLSVGDQPVTDVVVPVTPAARILGRLVFAGSSKPPVAVGGRDVVYVACGNAQIGERFLAPHLEDDFTFKTTGLPPATYSLMIFNLQTTQAKRDSQDWTMKWHVQSISIDGKRLPAPIIELGTTDATVVVTMSDTFAQLQGVVRDNSGRQRPDASIYLVPADPRLRALGARSMEYRADRHGAFDLSTYSGDYLVFASASAPEYWSESSTLERLLRYAVRVHIGDGERVRQDLTLQDGR